MVREVHSACGTLMIVAAVLLTTFADGGWGPASGALIPLARFPAFYGRSSQQRRAGPGIRVTELGYRVAGGETSAGHLAAGRAGIALIEAEAGTVFVRREVGARSTFGGVNACAGRHIAASAGTAVITTDAAPVAVRPKGLTTGAVHDWRTARPGCLIAGRAGIAEVETIAAPVASLQELLARPAFDDPAALTGGLIADPALTTALLDTDAAPGGVQPHLLTRGTGDRRNTGVDRLVTDRAATTFVDADAGAVLALLRVLARPAGDGGLATSSRDTGAVDAGLALRTDPPALSAVGRIGLRVNTGPAAADLPLRAAGLARGGHTGAVGADLAPAAGVIAQALAPTGAASPHSCTQALDAGLACAAVVVAATGTEGWTRTGTARLLTRAGRADGAPAALTAGEAQLADAGWGRDGGAPPSRQGGQRGANDATEEGLDHPAPRRAGREGSGQVIEPLAIHPAPCRWWCAASCRHGRRGQAPPQPPREGGTIHQHAERQTDQGDSTPRPNDSGPLAAYRPRRSVPR